MMMIPRAEKLNNIRYDIRGPICDESERMEAQGVPVVKLNTGNPAAFGFETPDYITRALEGGLALSAAYSQSRGLASAREAIVDYACKKGIRGVSVHDVYTGNGVSELIQITLQALLNQGDEILIPSPDYPLWTAAARLAGGTVRHYACDEQADWYPDIQDIRRKITPHTKALVLINPNNPTGALYPKDLLRQIVETAREHDLLLLSDEIYDRMVMDGREHTALASLDEDQPVVTFGGLSKSHHICGFRCGWMVVSGDQSGLSGFLEGLNVLSSMRLCSNVLSQSVIPAALADQTFTDSYLVPGGRLYEQRECAWRMLNEIPGISAVKPQAGLYLFPRMDLEQLRIRDDERFVLDFLKEKQVLLTHGRAYSWPTPDHFRVVYLPQVDQLTDVLDRLKEFLATYRQY